MNDKEEILLKNRILDLANATYFKNIQTNTLFLNLYEQTIFYSLQNILPKVKYLSYGGFEEAERKIVCFLPFYEKDFSFDMLSVLKVSPNNSKFSDKLTHRDFLGAIINLGIDRSNIGDIIISDNTAYIIVMTRLANVIKDNLNKIKHTKVKVTFSDMESLKSIDNSVEKIINIASMRLDVVIAAVLNKSRSKVSEFFLSGIVFINSKQSSNHSYMIKENDLISIRGYGRFKFLGVIKNTKKDRLVAEIKIY